MDFEYSDGQKKIIEDVRAICEEFREDCFQANQENERLPEDVRQRLIQAMRDRGLVGICVPKEWGGQGKSFLDYIIAMEHSCRYGTGLYLSYLINFSSAGHIMQVIEYGGEEAKKKYVKKSVNLEELFGLAMVEGGAGSAVTDIETTAVLDGDHYVVNGEKRWVGYGGYANSYYTWVREPGTRGPKGIFVLLIDKDTPGLEYGKDRGFWGVYQGHRHDLILKNCRVPKENMIIGSGQLRTVLGSFNTMRLQNAARTQGMAEGALDNAIKHATTRKQFGKHICEFQLVQGMLADMAMKVETGQLILYKAASGASAGMADPLPTSLAKEYCNQIAISVCDDACQIHGAYGFIRESDTEWRYRQARVFSLATGTSEMQRVRIASELLGRRFDQRLNAYIPEKD